MTRHKEHDLPQVKLGRQRVQGLQAQCFQSVYAIYFNSKKTQICSYILWTHVHEELKREVDNLGLHDPRMLLSILVPQFLSSNFLFHTEAFHQPDIAVTGTIPIPQ